MTLTERLRSAALAERASAPDHRDVYIERLCDKAADAIAERDARIADLEGALEQIADAPAWGYPERWETTPAEVRQLARTTLGEIAP